MPTYIQKDIVSDVSPYDAGNRELSVGEGSDGSFVVTLTAVEAEENHGFITLAEIPNSDSWESGGTFTVEVEVDVGNHSIDARVIIHRLDSDGNVIQTGIPTASQAMNASRVFSPVAPTWTAGEEDCGNRLAIVINFSHTTGMEHSCTIGLGTIANEVISDITENAGDCNDFGWFVQRPDVIRPQHQTQPGAFSQDLTQPAAAPIPDFGWFVQEPDVIRSRHQVRPGLSALVEFSVPILAAPDFGWFVPPADVIRSRHQVRPGLQALVEFDVLPKFDWFVPSADIVRSRHQISGLSVLVELGIAVAAVPDFGWFVPSPNIVRLPRLPVTGELAFVSVVVVTPAPPRTEPSATAAFPIISSRGSNLSY